MDAPREKPKMTRRRFLKLLGIGGAATAVVGTGYSAVEACWINDTFETVTIPRLPSAFKGLRVAFLTDIHHGPFTWLSYVKAIVARTNALKPDVIVLGGDYIHTDAKYIAPVFETLGSLSAPLGVYGVLGNHDHYHGAAECSAAMSAAGLVELTNSGVWLKKAGQRFRIAGLGDYWEDIQDLDAALDDCRSEETCLLLSHNPDPIEDITDGRVGLMLSGHTHGGQVVLPLVGPPYIPSQYGRKYMRGFVATPTSQVFVSRGLGTITPPLRFSCRPEINLLTLI